MVFVDRQIRTSCVDLSIVIVNWNTRELLADCLESIFENVHDLAYEVLVVDNASSDGSADMVRRRFPQARLIENEQNVGFARANNQAIRCSMGRYVLLLNSDTLTLPDSFLDMCRFLDAHPHVGIVGGTLLNPDGSFQASYADFPSLVSEAFLITGLSRVVYSRYFPSHPPSENSLPKSVDWVGGACLMARRSAIEEVGLLDEDYFMYSEEMDWCYRMKRRGWEVYYLPTARVIHVQGQSIRQAPYKQRVYLYSSKIRFFRKHYGLLTVTCLRAIVTAASLARAAYWLSLGLCKTGVRTRAWGEVRASLQLILGLS